jgi:predicted RNA binding protein YcfA (HicA-like mRNA interferase family)
MNSRMDKTKGWEKNRKKGDKKIKEQNSRSVGTVPMHSREEG